MNCMEQDESKVHTLYCEIVIICVVISPALLDGGDGEVVGAERRGGGAPRRPRA
jgi:hypothetical protein